MIHTILNHEDPSQSVRRVTAEVGAEFEFGTGRFRASLLARLVRDHVPPGTPVVVSDDPPAWRAATELAEWYPVIGVLHADDEHYYKLAETFHTRLAALTCVSDRILQTVVARIPRLSVPVQRIPCGVPLGPPRSEIERSSEVRLVWVGRIEERQKRVSDLPRLLEAVNARGVSARLDIIGDGPDARLLHSAIRRAGVEDRTSLHGWVDATAVRAQLLSRDIFLLPSNFEGMPVAVMEALAAGCGVVAASVSGIEDYAGHALATGCYREYPVGDVSAGVDAVLALAAIPIAERVQSARALAESEFSIAACVSRYYELARRVGRLERTPVSLPLWTRVARAASAPVSALRRLRIRLRPSRLGVADAAEHNA